MSPAPLGLALDADLPAASLQRLVEGRIASRLFAADDTLWGDDAQPEASIRLGWVTPDGVDGATEALIEQIELLRTEFLAAGVDRFVLSGMGGSSLAPEVITRRYGVELHILDSTHPERVRRAIGDDLSRTALVVSSKSGSTVETQSHRASFEAAFTAQGIEAAGRIVVVTDPGSPFAASAAERGNRVFLADPNVGGRYSALTAFGLVPSGLAGADVRGLLAEARAVREELAADDLENPALKLAVAIHEGLPSRFAVVLAPGEDPGAAPHSHDPEAPVAAPSAVVSDWGLPDWIEQLVAESTGKHGQGVLPVAVHAGAPETKGQLAKTAQLLGVAPLPAHATGDRLTGPLGAQFLCWEAATAVLGHLMGINPFDQPDVESAKVATRALLGTDSPEQDALGQLEDIPGAAILRFPGLASQNEVLPSTAPALWQALFAQLQPDSYLAVQAYLDSGSPVAQELEELREQLAERLDVPVTLGWGPRFLHSTGQLHKGGPAVGVFLQLTDAVTADLDIPDSPQSYHELISAQAAGDANVLTERGRPVLTVRLSDPTAGVHALRVALAELSGEKR